MTQRLGQQPNISMRPLAKAIYSILMSSLRDGCIATTLVAWSFALFSMTHDIGALREAGARASDEGVRTMLATASNEQVLANLLSGYYAASLVVGLYAIVASILLRATIPWVRRAFARRVPSQDNGDTGLVARRGGEV